ncbi:MAG: mechanosensitive ion channel family protein [Firmicutes bacterium]|nr:mechanosensitive ion channel family protein [Bacillota bacterium]
MENIISTLNTISSYYNTVTLERIGLAFLIFFTFLLFKNIISKYIFKILTSFTSKTKSTIDDDILKAFRKPMSSFIMILGVYISLRYLDFSESFNETLLKFFKSAVIILIAKGLYKLEGTYSIIFDRMEYRLNINTTKILKPFFSKALRIFTIAITIAIVAEEFGYHISAFIAGLGLGGLAIAMAAKDTLANIFGGITIIMDKPFDIGDWIKSEETEGVVEDINFRSTKVRTFDKALVTIPNAKLADSPIINYSRRGVRRINFHLGVTYGTPVKKMKECINDIEKMLIDHEKVENDFIVVRFEEFNDSSLDILLYFFIETSDYEELLTIKQDINFNIMEILEERKVSVAFPSTSIYFENKLEAKNYMNE